MPASSIHEERMARSLPCYTDSEGTCCCLFATQVQAHGGNATVQSILYTMDTLIPSRFGARNNRPNYDPGQVAKDGSDVVTPSESILIADDTEVAASYGPSEPLKSNFDRVVEAAYFKDSLDEHTSDQDFDTRTARARLRHIYMMVEAAEQPLENLKDFCISQREELRIPFERRLQPSADHQLNLAIVIEKMIEDARYSMERLVEYVQRTNTWEHVARVALKSLLERMGFDTEELDLVKK